MNIRTVKLNLGNPTFSPKKLFVGPHCDIGVVFHHWKTFPWACLFLSPGTSDSFKNRCKLNSFSGRVLANIRAVKLILEIQNFRLKSCLWVHIAI